ncbi:cytochrome c3 family protein [Candidatus Hydrogenedentota bacterium]
MFEGSKTKWVVAICLILLTGACMTFRNGSPSRPDRGLRFNHTVHDEHADQGLECIDCHAFEDDMPMPDHDFCSACHDFDEEDPTAETCGLCHTKKDYATAPRQKLLRSELKFTHGPHITEDDSCGKCHEDPDKKPFPSGSFKPFCMDCHEKAGVEMLECAVCHSETTKDTVPTHRGTVKISHDAPRIWENVHGRESQFAPEYCAICHETENFCEECHSANPPRSHTVSWRRKTHGIEASWDRGKCATCHEEDSCLICHQNTKPASHRSGWGGQRNTHCWSCHIETGGSNCTVCHESIEHESAGISIHNAGVFPENCSICHPGGVPTRAPHRLNQSASCTECHS